MLFMGIDPGLDGAVAVLNNDEEIVGIHDSRWIRVGTKRKHCSADMGDIIDKYTNRSDDIKCVGIEDVHSMPKQGVSSSFQFGRGLGIWEGIIAFCKFKMEFISPQKWKKEMLHGMQKGKDAALYKCQQLYPKSSYFKLKKHHGRADAVLIALYMVRKYRRK